jgi:catechol-2,3-dioxygenase
MRQVTHLRRVGITAPDPIGLARFYEDVWGLQKAGEQDGAAYLRGSGAEHHILTIYPSQRSTVRHISLGLPDRDAVDEAYQTLSQRRGITVARLPASIDEPGGGYGFRITDVDGRFIELSSDVASAETGGDHYAVTRPTKISHVVLNSAQVDAFAELLTDVLGLRLSDETAHMAFFRCNADHHSVAIARAPHASLNHVAFEVPTQDDVLRGIEHMQNNGIPTLWGPGRHGPGDNVFGYFRAPNGQVIEYTSELQQIQDEDGYVPRFWAPEDYRLRDPWATPDSLRPSEEARQAMVGQPEVYAYAPGRQ